MENNFGAFTFVPMQVNYLANRQCPCPLQQSPEGLACACIVLTHACRFRRPTWLPSAKGEVRGAYLNDVHKIFSLWFRSLLHHHYRLLHRIHTPSPCPPSADFIWEWPLKESRPQPSLSTSLQLAELLSTEIPRKAAGLPSSRDDMSHM